MLARLISPEGEQAQLQIVADLEAGSLLDVGCGTGSLMFLTMEQSVTCYGIDTSPGMLTQASKKAPQANLNQASFYNIPYANNTFDYVVETNALSGVDISAELVIMEMLRVCRIGGEVRIGDYAEPPIRTWKHKLVEGIGILVGDYPYNYQQLFTNLGYQPDIIFLGGQKMYQVIRVQKTH